jgi:hypothetical protein
MSSNRSLSIACLIISSLLGSAALLAQPGPTCSVLVEESCEDCVHIPAGFCSAPASYACADEPCVGECSCDGTVSWRNSSRLKLVYDPDGMDDFDSVLKPCGWAQACRFECDMGFCKGDGDLALWNCVDYRLEGSECVAE